MSASLGTTKDSGSPGGGDAAGRGSSDLTFITNEPGKHMCDRFGDLLREDTRFFDCLAGCFFISGFHRIYPSLTNTEKIRILIGLKTDRATFDLIQTAKEQQEFVLESHAQVRERVPGEILGEFQKSGDSAKIEDGVRKFVEWIKSGKLEVRAFPSERLHAKLYIMTFHDGDRDRGRVITGSSNFTEAGLQDNLEAFFGALRRRREGFDRQRDRDVFFRTVQENARQTREKILKFLMIRRTRTEIEKYYGEDLKRQGLKCPEVVNPEPLFYKFNKTEAEVFDETIRSFTHDFKYARYTPLAYYTGERTEREIQSQRNLAKFMKILTVKRLESSFTAFLSTLGRFIHTYERVIAEYDKGHVFISKKHIGKVFELLCLPQKARSTRTISASPGGGEGRAETASVAAQIQSFPSLLTYFRQGKLDKFFLGASGKHSTIELDFMSAAKILKPADPKEARQPIPREFYDLLDKNTAAFVIATTADAEQAASTHRGSANDAYILKRLKDTAVRRCPQSTEDDEELVGKVIRLVEDGSLPKATAKKVAAALKKPENLQPLKVLAVLRRDIKPEIFQVNPAAHASQAFAPREVILSSWLIGGGGEGGAHG